MQSEREGMGEGDTEGKERKLQIMARSCLTFNTLWCKHSHMREWERLGQVSLLRCVCMCAHV